MRKEIVILSVRGTQFVGIVEFPEDMNPDEYADYVFDLLEDVIVEI